MRAAFRKINKQHVYLAAMGASLLLSLLPASAGNSIRGVFQPVGWLQSAAVTGLRQLLAGVRGTDTPGGLSASDAERLATERQLLQQAALIEELERQVEILTGLRGQLPHQRGRIILARVIAYESTPARAALTLSRGSQAGIESGQWVVSGSPDVHSTTRTGLQSLMRQWVLGKVVRADPYQSQVELTTDRRFLSRASLMRPDAPDAPLLDVLVRGTGDGLMVEQVPGNPLESGYTAILLGPAAGLPFNLLAGRVIQASAVAGAPLYSHLMAEPILPARELSNVCVLAVSP